MTRGIYIQSNNNQLLAAKVARHAIETRGRAQAHGIPVTIMNVDEMEPFRAFAGVPFRFGDRMCTYDLRSVQSFTLSRFMPPELMGYSGRALVIDPDVFALADVGDLFATDLEDKAIAACWENWGWESSVMLLDCAKLSHWKINDVLAALRTLSVDYFDLIFLRREQSVAVLPGMWNTLDRLGPETKMLHTTHKQTQPWKTGLPLGTVESPRLFGFLPRPPLRRLLFKPPRYQPHPDRAVERTFMLFLREALKAGAVTEANIAEAIARKYVRADLREQLALD